LESDYQFAYTPNTLEFVDLLHGWTLADNSPAAGSELVSLYQTNDGGCRPSSAQALKKL
jgi:hypothetical protein